MAGRKYAATTSYRYGFNGKENDNEVKGEANSQDYGMRIYDPRLGRFLSVDPITKDYPWYTPYQFAGDCPILSIDIDGMEEDKNINAVQGGDISLSNPTYIQGKGGDKLASRYYLTPWWSPIQRVESGWVAQAAHFSNAIGGKMYAENMTTSSSRPFVIGVHHIAPGETVHIRISTDHDIIEGALKIVRDNKQLDVLGDDLIKTFLTDQVFVFKQGQDYSSLFMIKFPQVQLAGAGTLPITMPASIPVALPLNAASTNSGNIIVSNKVIAEDLAGAAIPFLNLMAKVKKKVEGNTELERAQNQLDGIEKAQEESAESKEPGQKKQSKISSIQKSLRRLKNALKNIKSSKDVQEE